MLLVLALTLVACGRGAPIGGGDDARLLDLDAAGAVARVEQHEGATPVLLNLWASWCAPCRDEAPVLAAAERRYRGRVAFLGINYQDSHEGARAFLDTFSIRFPSVFDPSGAVAREFGLRGIPVTVILDRDGAEIFRRVGTLTESELVAALERAVAAG